MADADWTKIAIDGILSLASGLGGLALGIWRWGRDSARAQQAVKDDYNGKIATLREETKAAMAKQTESSGSRNDLLVEQFKESFEGMRRQIDEHRFYTERDFVKKEDFKDFREEYRDDMRDLKAAIASIPRKQ
jgi:hypothetical protein